MMALHSITNQNRDCTV